MMYEPGAQAKETPGLEDYLAAIRQRKWLVLLAALAGLAAAVAFTVLMTKTYEASAKVLVNPTRVGSTDSRLTAPVLEREREVIASNAVARLVAEDLGITESPLLLLRNLEVVFVDDSDSLELLYVDEDARVAQDIVNAFARSFVDKRNAEADALDQTTLSELEAIIASIDEQIAGLQSEIDESSIERDREIGLGGTGIEQNDQILDARASIQALRADRRNIAQDLSDAQIAQSTRTPPAEVLQFADTPMVPTGLSDNIIRALGLVLGLGAGAALAFVLQRLDRTARDSGDVELALNTSVLASIPAFGVTNRSGSSSIVMLAGGRSTRVQQAREAFRRLRSSLQFLGSSRDATSFLVTSARPTEGKSTIAINTAVALAQSSSKVCLVNADLRRPAIERLLGISNQRGLADWLSDPTVTNIMVPIPGIPGLVVVPSGPPPSNPGELLGSGRFTELIDELESQFDVVIVDAPPVLSTADASSISTAVDGTIIAVDSNRTDTDTLLRVRAEVERAGGHVMGAILNRDRTDTGLSLRRDRYAYEKVSASRSES